MPKVGAQFPGDQDPAHAGVSSGAPRPNRRSRPRSTPASSHRSPARRAPRAASNALTMPAKSKRCTLRSSNGSFELALNAAIASATICRLRPPDRGPCGEAVGMQRPLQGRLGIRRWKLLDQQRGRERGAVHLAQAADQPHSGVAAKHALPRRLVLAAIFSARLGRAAFFAAGCFRQPISGRRQPHPPWPTLRYRSPGRFGQSSRFYRVRTAETSTVWRHEPLVNAPPGACYLPAIARNLAYFIMLLKQPIDMCTNPGTPSRKPRRTK